MSALEIVGGEDKANIVLRFYEMALRKNFTKGRRREVYAACVYIMCRVENKPFLLIEFSEHLRINVYVLGAVLEENPLIQNLVDPSLFIHRFSDRATCQSNSIHDTIDKTMDASDFTLEESENLSDIDDTEVDAYINTQEEKKLKTTVWEEINREIFRYMLGEPGQTTEACC
ncbi:transcription factor IIIB 60 kDa subunit-like [Salvia splendens]|uniref:transcription factor IIIB 60 kDa subunit-like n=1 Tax=Salvia splendens TaxID=180675 RepID=UPI001C264C5E|nr:transcription factor IIIB 60 kDa subunit-like [Salvia splendens]